MGNDKSVAIWQAETCATGGYLCGHAHRNDAAKAEDAQAGCQAVKSSAIPRWIRVYKHM